MSKKIYAFKFRVIVWAMCAYALIYLIYDVELNHWEKMMLAVALVVGVLQSRIKVAVGDDGLTVQGYVKKTYVPFEKLTSIQNEKSTLYFLAADGKILASVTDKLSGVEELVGQFTPEAPALVIKHPPRLKRLPLVLIGVLVVIWHGFMGLIIASRPPKMAYELSFVDIEMCRWILLMALTYGAIYRIEKKLARRKRQANFMSYLKLAGATLVIPTLMALVFLVTPYPYRAKITLASGNTVIIDTRYSYHHPESLLFPGDRVVFFDPNQKAYVYGRVKTMPERSPASKVEVILGRKQMAQINYMRVLGKIVR